MPCLELLAQGVAVHQRKCSFLVCHLNHNLFPLNLTTFLFIMEDISQLFSANAKKVPMTGHLNISSPQSSSIGCLGTHPSGTYADLQ